MDPIALALASSSVSPTHIADTEGNPVYANAAWTSLVGAGAPPSALRSLVADEEDLQRLDDVLIGVDVQSADPARRAWVRLAAPSESSRWWTVSHIPAFGADGELVATITAVVLALGDSQPGQATWSEQDALAKASQIAQMGVWDWDISTGALWWSEQIYSIFGLEPQEFPATYDAFIAHVHPDDRREVQIRVGRAVEGIEDYSLRHRVLRPDGTIRYVREHGLVKRDRFGTPVRMLGTVNDVTDETERELAREGAHAALAASEERYRLLAENASDIVWQIGADSKIAWVSDSVRMVLGWRPDEMVGRPAMDFLHPEDREHVARDLSAALVGGAARAEIRLLCPDGSTRWMASHLHVAPGAKTNMLVGSLRDIGDEVAARQELAHAVGHDLVTGLANRHSTINRLEAGLASQQANRSVGVLCIGIDSLTAINDAISHTAGDRVLAATAARVVGLIGDADLVGRGSGNELHVILPGLRAPADAGLTAEKLRRDVPHPMNLAGQQVAPTLSIGIATGARGDDAERLLRDAALAMRQAKQKGRNRFEYFDPQVGIEALSQLQLEADIRSGLQAGEFVPWFQPIVELPSGTVVGYEALVRWIRPDGPVDAWRFLPVAERGLLITELDLAMLPTVLRRLAETAEGIFMSVNVAASTLRRPTYADEVLSAAAGAGVSLDRLHLEVTETALLDVTPQVRAGMERLAAAGASWYVDDFGTGYSSISHLRDLPIAGLKLDRSFVAGIEAGDDTCINLADGLVGLADGLRLDTVAEGIEVAEQAELLADQGWAHGQGWLYGKPSPELVG